MSSAQLHWDKIVDNLSYQLSSKPAPRRDSAIGHDRERNRVILFGGWQQLNENVPTISIPVLFDDTWEFNLETSRNNFTLNKNTINVMLKFKNYGES